MLYRDSFKLTDLQLLSFSIVPFILATKLICVHDYYNFSASNDVEDRMSTRKKQPFGFGRCTRNVESGLSCKPQFLTA
jgi:hypothetical protein